MSLRHTPFRRVLHRPKLFLGGERELTLSTAIVALALAVTGQNLIALGVAALLWGGCIGVFRTMAKADPQMSKVYFRQLRYRGYYPARSRPYIGGSTMGAAKQWSIIAAGVLVAVVLLVGIS